MTSALDYRPRVLTQVAAPAVEPLGLAETKLFLRVDSSAEDTLITSLITTARVAAEEYLRRSLITQTWKLAYDDLLPSRVVLPKGPVQSVSSVVSVARDGEVVTASEGGYFLTAGKDVLVNEVAVYGHQVEVSYVAGYGSAGANVPSPIRQGMLQHIAVLYDNRQGVELPEKALYLYFPYRAGAL